MGNAFVNGPVNSSCNLERPTVGGEVYIGDSNVSLLLPIDRTDCVVLVSTLYVKVYNIFRTHGDGHQN